MSKPTTRELFDYMLEPLIDSAKREAMIHVLTSSERRGEPATLGDLLTLSLDGGFEFAEFDDTRVGDLVGDDRYCELVVDLFERLDLGGEIDHADPRLSIPLRQLSQPRETAQPTALVSERLWKLDQAERRAVGTLHQAERAVGRAVDSLEVIIGRAFRGLAWLAGDREAEEPRRAW